LALAPIHESDENDRQHQQGLYVESVRSLKMPLLLRVDLSGYPDKDQALYMSYLVPL
jgi:hypothetical protein